MPVVTANNQPQTNQSKPAPQGFKQKPTKDFEAIPEGVYNAEIARIEYRSRELTEAAGKAWPSWKKDDHEINIGFRITDGNFKNRWFWDSAPLDLSEGSQLRIWLQEIVGMTPLPDDFQFDTDELDFYEGLDCRIRLNTYWSKKNQKDQNGIAEVLRAGTSTYDDADDMF